MSAFDEFIKQNKVEPNMSGDFDCQWCDRSVSEGYYDPNLKILRWYCDEGHESFIEKVTL